MTDTLYYIERDVSFDPAGAVVGAFSAAFITAISDKIKAFTVGQHVAKFVTSVGGEFLTTNITLDVMGGGITVKGENGQPDIFVALGSLSEIAFTTAVVNAIGIAFALEGVPIVAVAFGVALAWSGIKEVGEEINQSFTGEVDQRFELLDSSGNVLAGALHQTPPSSLQFGVGDLLNKAVSKYGLTISDNMTVTAQGEHFWGLYTVAERTFKIYDDGFMDKVSDAIFGGSEQAFLDHGQNLSNTDDVNAQFYSQAAGVFFARDGIDKIYVPTEHANQSITGYHITDIISGSGSITGDTDANLIIGSSSSDTLNGSAGIDYLIGGAGNDDFIGRGTSSGLDGDTFIGGSISYNIGVPSQATRGLSDGDDWVIYSSSSLGVKVDLTNTNQQNQSGYAYAINSSGVQVGDFTHVDRLVSIENIIGSSKGDKLVGSEISNTIFGRGGADEIFGGNGVDYLHGEGGNDLFYGIADGDFIDGGALIDTVAYSYLDSTGYGIHVVGVGSEYHVYKWDGSSNIGSIYDTLSSIEHIKGTSNSDYFEFGSKKIVFSGGNGNDVYDINSNSSYSYINELANGGNDSIFALNYLPENTTGTAQGNSGVDIQHDNNGGSIWFPYAEHLESISPTASTSIAIEQYIDEDEDDDPNAPGTPQWMKDLLDDWGTAENAPVPISPLILDLDGQGIDLASVLGTGAVYWDIDQDGFAEASGWISGNDGLLAIDLNSDGIINDHGELFGTETVDGFTVLSAYDSNADNVIDVNDAQFGDLLVWVDANSDGYSQSGELFSLTDLNITSINLNASLVNYDIAGNNVTHESTFTINGQTQTIVDAWFAYDNTNSHYQESFTLDVRTLYLPNLRGFGDVKDLHIAMSLDETLLLMVQEIAVADKATLFDPAFDLNGKMEAVLYRWAGVDGVDPASRGVYVDARQLEFLEKYLGDSFDHNTGNTPTVGAGGLATGIFVSAISALTSHILIQTSASSFFGEDAYYDFALGTIENSSLDGMYFLTPNQIMNQTTDTSNAYVISDINSSYEISENNGGGYDEIWIQGVQESELRLVRVGLNLEINIGSETITVVNHFKSDQHLNSSYDYYQVENIVLDDGTKIDLLNNVTFTGTSGADVLQGLYADDIFIGDTGDDEIRGGTGDDNYIWSIGDGNDTIQESGGSDTLILHGMLQSGVSFVQSGNNLSINIGSETITVENYFLTNNDNKVENVTFDDGSVVDLQVLLNTAPTAQDDAFIGDQDLSLSGNVLVNNGSGLDNDLDGNILSVVAGTYASLHGSVVVSVNGDFIYTPTTGYNGADSFVYTLDDGFGGSDTATVNITVRPPNVAPIAQDDAFAGDEDISITGNVLSDNGNGVDADPDSDPITVVAGTYTTANGSVVISSNGSFTYTSSTGYVGADSFTYTLQDDRGGSDIGTANITVNALANNPNAINGTSANDTLNGDPSGISNDILIGYGGNDILNGKLGNDSYVWSVGDGNDTINETGGIDRLVLHGVVASDISLEYMSDGSLKVHIGSEAITVIYHFYSDKYSSSYYDTYQVESILLDDGSAIDLLNNITLTGTASSETINGLNAATTFIGKAGNDILNGKLGNDSYVWSVGDGDDTINETGGVDQLVLHGVIASDLRFENMLDGSLKVHIGSEAITVIYHFYSDKYSSSYYDTYHLESILLDDGSTIDLLNSLTFTGTAGGETIIGTNGDDVLYGLAGNDIINASGGADTLIGGSGIDTLNGNLGNDSYVWSVGDGNDIINETGGVDQLVLHGVIASDIGFEYMFDGSLKVHIGSEEITVVYHFYSDKYSSSYYDTYHVESILLDDGSTIDLLNNITLTGTANSETIDGLNAATTFVGEAGNDILNGKLGNDSYVWSVGDGNDTINETGGVDQLVLHGVLASDLRFENMLDGSLKVHIGNEEITVVYHFYSDKYSSSYYDTYHVESILLDDGSTIDLLNNLTFTGTASGETINGLNANDILFGLDGADTLNGNNGNDVLHGGEGSDYLYGNAGDDVLYGGAGIDMLYGQAGTDTFVFESSTAFTASDNIQDFSLSDGDKLDVSDLLIGYDPLTDAISDFVQITESGSNSYLSVDADGGADNFVQVAYIYNETGLTDEDALETSGNLIAA